MTLSFNNVNLLEKGELAVNEQSPRSFSTTSTLSKFQPSEPSDGTIPQKDIPNLGQGPQRISKFSPISLLSKIWSNWGTRSSVPRNVTVRKLEDCPNGYPRLSTFLDSHENFMIYRRFGYLQSRLLLEKQDDLRKVERQLDNLDQRIHAKREADSTTRDLPEDDARPRKELMMKVEKTFCEYVSLLDSARKIATMNRPARSDYNSVQNFIFGTRPLCQAEEKWIHCKEDLITLRPGREHSYLDRGIEYLLRMLHCAVIEYIFCSKETKLKTEGRSKKAEVYYTKSRIDKLVALIIILMILALLIVPIYVLYHLVRDLGNGRTEATCIVVLLLSTLAFSAVLGLFTRAKRHEILAAAAAYCAVLVVFLGNVTPGN